VAMNQHHIDAGLKIPDKFEIDVDNPGNRGVACWSPEHVKPELPADRKTDGRGKRRMGCFKSINNVL
jgi:hypothetical protein